MTLAEFRASRRVITISEAEAEMPFLSDMDLSPEYTHVCVYAGGEFILQSRRGFYLMVEQDEYESRDLALLEFVLWQWSAEDTADIAASRAMIWG